jgi:uncharacterized protein YqeY
MILSAAKLAEVEKREPLDEDELLTIIQKEAKSRKETIADAEQAGREDIIEASQRELEILEVFLPKPLSDGELKELAQAAIEETGAEGMQEMGKVMSLVMPRVRGRADGRTVGQIVRELLSKE